MKQSQEVGEKCEMGILRGEDGQAVKFSYVVLGAFRERALMLDGVAGNTKGGLRGVELTICTDPMILRKENNATRLAGDSIVNCIQ